MKRSFKQVVFVAAMGALMAFALVACGGSNSSSSSSSSSAMSVSDNPSYSSAASSAAAASSASSAAASSSASSSAASSSAAVSSSSAAASASRPIGNGYVGEWFLDGDKTKPFITISDDGTWAMFFSDDGSTEGNCINTGTASMMENGAIELFEFSGALVGEAMVEGDTLTVIFTQDFEWMKLESEADSLVFKRV